MKTKKTYEDQLMAAVKDADEDPISIPELRRLVGQFIAHYMSEDFEFFKVMNPENRKKFFEKFFKTLY